MKFEIQVPKNGKNPGTIGWLKDQLENSKLEVSTTSKGETCLVWVKHINEKGEILNEPLRLVIAIIRNAYPTELNSYYAENDYLERVFVQDNDHQIGLFQSILSPAAFDKAKEFLLNSVNEFWESFLNDFQEEKLEVEF